jgi:hypothetical protein
MKLKAPLTNKKEVKLLCEAGANELFCGIEPNAWRAKFKDFCINQRSRGSNFTELSDLEEAISIAHEYGTKVHVTVNAFFYLEEQYGMAERIIEDVVGRGADGIIFADPALISKMDEALLKGKDKIIGTDAVVFNSSAVAFYKRLGGTRVVLPRAMTLDEMKAVIEKDRSMEYEVFVIHDLCFFVDGFCSYCKEGAGTIKKETDNGENVVFFTASRLPQRGFGGGCRTSFKRQRISARTSRQIGSRTPFTFWMQKHIEGCGACALYDFEKIGVTSLKVLDRNLPTAGKVQATEFMKKSLDLLENDGISKSDYVDKCRNLFEKTFNVRCNRYDCYYPSVFS